MSQPNTYLHAAPGYRHGASGRSQESGCIKKKRVKAGFSPDFDSQGKRVWKRQNNPSASAAFAAFGCRCLVFLVLASACAAVRFWLLLSTLSRLTHILFQSY